MRSCYESAIIDRVAARLVPARPTVVCRSTPVLKKHHESQRNRQPIKTLTHSVSKWRGCSSEVREVKLMHCESRRYTRLSWSLTSCFDVVWCEGACAGRRVHMLNPCPLCRPQESHVSFSPPSPSRSPNGDKKTPHAVTQLTGRFSSDRQHLLHSLAQASLSIPGASKYDAVSRSFEIFQPLDRDRMFFDSLLQV
jgi:hypothetical protein